jgi:hypothetical protein
MWSRQPDTPVILIGTKGDMSSQRMVAIEDASGFARSKGIRYIEVSTVTEENMEELLVVMAELAQMYKYISYYLASSFLISGSIPVGVVKDI